MYGKIFESMFQGSMVGSGSPTFAVWSYVLANMQPDREVGAQVELNPKVLGFLLGEKEEEVERVITKLCSPDANSRTKTHEGKRLVRLGEFTYQVVNGAKYREIRSADERREYHRNYQRKRRGESVKAGTVPSIPIESKDVVEIATEAAESFLPPDNGGPENKVSIDVLARKRSLERRLDAHFKRPAGVSRDHDEDKKLWQIAHRPSCKEELDTILAHYNSLPKDKIQYYPMASVSKLLEGWTKLLDTARMASGANPTDPEAQARGDALWEKMAPAFAKGIGDQFRVNP